jgi:hypothetical protein
MPPVGSLLSGVAAIDELATGRTPPFVSDPGSRLGHIPFCPQAEDLVGRVGKTLIASGDLEIQADVIG